MLVCLCDLFLIWQLQYNKPRNKYCFDSGSPAYKHWNYRGKQHFMCGYELWACIYWCTLYNWFWRDNMQNWIRLIKRAIQRLMKLLFPRVCVEMPNFERQEYMRLKFTNFFGGWRFFSKVNICLQQGVRFWPWGVKIAGQRS